MNFNFSEGVRRALQRARDASAELHHQYVGPEHILLGVLQDKDAIALLTDLSINAPSLREGFTRSLKPGSAPPSNDFPYTPNAKRVLEDAMHQARDLKSAYLGIEHVVLAIVHVGESPAAEVLQNAGLTVETVREAVRRRVPAEERPTFLERFVHALEPKASGHGYNFTDRVRTVLQMAREEAAGLHHEYVGTEHILLGLIREGDGVAIAVLMNLSVDIDKIVNAIGETVKEGKGTARPGQDIPYTSRAKKVLEFSMSAARELNHAYVGTEHLLLGLLREEKGIAAQVLTDAGVDFDMVRAETLRLLEAEAPPPTPTLPPTQLDQAFKTAIALIELHHRRFGAYPDSLAQLPFTGPQDGRDLKIVRYEKLSDGYGLNVLWPEGAKPGLQYPPDFWRGLGIRRTNVDGFEKPS